MRRLNALAADHGLSLAQFALAWLLSRPALTSVIVGASSPAQLRDSLRAADLPPLSPEILAAIPATL